MNDWIRFNDKRPYTGQSIWEWKEGYGPVPVFFTMHHWGLFGCTHWMPCPIPKPPFIPKTKRRLKITSKIPAKK